MMRRGRQDNIQKFWPFHRRVAEDAEIAQKKFKNILEEEAEKVVSDALASSAAAGA